MDPRNAASGMSDPDAGDFVRFCYHRRRVGWPELYDEMCAVAGRGLFRGYDADDLAGLGIGFSLFDMPALAVLSARIVAEEQALRTPVAVMIKPEAATVSEPQPTAAAPIVKTTESTREPAHTVHPERNPEVPIRLTLVPSGA
jgi:hypothetical protein